MLAGPDLVRYGIDHGIDGDDPDALNLAGSLFIVAALGGFFFARYAILLVAQVGETFLRGLRVHDSGTSWISASISSRRSRPVGSSPE